MTDWMHAHWGGIMQWLIALLTPPEWPAPSTPPPSPSYTKAGNDNDEDQEPCHTSNDRPVVLELADEFRLVPWRAARRGRRE